jgi:DNA-binding Xre family transcriptional regulator
LAELPTLFFPVYVTLCVEILLMKDKDKKRLKKFAAQLTKLRKKRGLSMRELSSRCDVDYGKISKLENNKANLTLTTLFELAEGLEVHPKDLLDFNSE